MKNANTGLRITLVYACTVILMFAGVMRIYSVANDEKIQTAAKNNNYRITLTDLRGTVFDRNLLPVTNKQQKILAVVMPTPRAITAIRQELYGERLESALSLLKSGKPAVVQVEREIDCDGITCVKVPVHLSQDTLCPQLIGYTDEENHGVCGIEYSFDDALYTDEKLQVLLADDGNGDLLYGAEAEIIGDTSVTDSGIALTLDTNIQAVTADAMKDIISGAAVVSEVGTGKIRAMVSMPQFDITRVSEYLNSENSPLVNRALCAYNVGSAFKPCVAAAVLEDGRFSSFTTDCTGSTDIDGHVFKCHKLSGHGTVDLKSALTYSCNVFFYEISCKVGGRAIYDMASKLSFGNKIDLGGIFTDSGSITSAQKLESNSHATANLAIGQGELLLSPVSILTLYEAIANGGVYHMPSIIEGSVKRGLLSKNAAPVPTRAMSRETADTIKNYLCSVVESGTGAAAGPEKTTAAGKTATAETGWQKDGVLIQNSWFCGFFPVENPKYAVAVLIEDTQKNGTAGAPVFKKIADGITTLENSLS